MGAVPYCYIVNYDPDIGAALQALRRREFEAGRYNPVIAFPFAHSGAEKPSPGAKHASIEDAMDEAAEDGTRSILDIHRVGETPDFFTASPSPAATLHALYGTDKPSRAMVLDNMSFSDSIERLQCTYIVLWEDNAPREILFYGLSAD